MEENRRTAILKKVLEKEPLPSLSPVTVQLLRAAADEGSSASDLADIIRKDPGLTTRLLRLVGSVFYYRQDRVTSISQAVVLVGFKRLRLMALGVSLRDTFPMGRKDGVDYDQFWKISLYRAFIAQALARLAEQEGVDPEEAFVGGLILEIGMLMLFHCVSLKEAGCPFPGVDLPLEEIIGWEEEALGINHREVGRIILNRWRFPDALVETQKYLGAEVFSASRSPLCKMVELARKATEIVCRPSGDLQGLYGLADQVFKLSPEDVNRAISKSFKRVEELAEQLSIKMDSSADIMNVMENANRALARISASMDTSLQRLIGQVKQYSESYSKMSEAMVESNTAVFQNTLDAVAHEIRNPLLAIGGFARRLTQNAERADQGKKYAEVIVAEAMRLEQVLNEMMRYCRQYEPKFIEENMISVIEGVVDEFADILRDKEIRLERDFPEERLEVYMDPEGIAHVLRELLRHIIEGMNSAPGSLSLSLRAFWENDLVLIRISSDGRPMPDNVKESLLYSNLSSKSFDVGLGLPMVRRILNAHSGRVEIYGRGDTENGVDLYLPIRQSAGKQALSM
ncbi:MAG: HDOD domain-containing protein [Deltaproteobacteria bacterium]|nr:HDOD domain-containing protein [Deltaproteobacteria bacterium]MBW2139208.1 HDOD domain-containing protein [Deltaproteobacteria bacterium]